MPTWSAVSFPDQFGRVLVLAPHTDDGEFGAGGTIAKLVDEGREVRYVAFSPAVRSVPEGFPRDVLRQEVRRATGTLGIPETHLTVFDYDVRTFPTVRQDILEDMIVVARDFAPDLVLAPTVNDVHQDHETIAREALRAFKRTTLLGYEIPWNHYTFNQQLYVRLAPEHVDRKVAALACYESQQHRNYANPEYIRGLAATRGINVNTPWAEVFEVYRWIV
jgi:LmbE family N-acetylglucosaminyl deacetylase